MPAVCRKNRWLRGLKQPANISKAFAVQEGCLPMKTEMIHKTILRMMLFAIVSAILGLAACSAQPAASANAKVSTHLMHSNGRSYVAIHNQNIEVDPASAGVDVDVNGRLLPFQDTALSELLTVHGAGTDKNRIFAYNPGYDGWFEVIRNNHPVDQSAAPSEQMKQREAAMNDPIHVSLEQVQNGDWTESVLLSGSVSAFPVDWKFAGNALNHVFDQDSDELTDRTLLYTSNKLPVDFHGVISIGSAVIGVQPFEVWNPTDLTKPDRTQILIANIGIGQERLSKAQVPNYLNAVYVSRWSPILVIKTAAYDDITGVLFTMAAQPSVLAINQFSNNTPADLDFLKLYMKQTMKSARLDPNGWPIGQTPPFFIDIKNIHMQNIIWLGK